MSFVNGIKRVGRAIGRVAMPVGVIAGSMAGSYGLYKLYHHFLVPQRAERRIVDPPETSPYRTTLHQLWQADLNKFRVSPVDAPDACFIFDPFGSTKEKDKEGNLIKDKEGNATITERVIKSEGMDFGMRRALQMDDQETFKCLRRGVRKLSDDGLPAWRSYIPVADGKWVIKNDRDAASALDADMGIAFSYLEAAGRIAAGRFREEGDFTYQNLLREARQMMGIIYDKGIKRLGPNLLFSPSEDWGYERGAVIANVSYPVLYMLEAFAATDPNPSHNWRKVVEDNLRLREEIIELSYNPSRRRIRTGRGEETVDLTGIPDWVAVTWSPEKGYEFYTPGNRSYLTGYDAYRTLLNIALDATLARDENVRERNLKLAQYLMGKVAGATPEETIRKIYDLAIYTEVPGQEKPMPIFCREMLLGVYAALANSINHPHRQELGRQLINIYGEHVYSDGLMGVGFNKDNNEETGTLFSCPANRDYTRDYERLDEKGKWTKIENGVMIEDYYYDQFIIALAMQTLESGYRRFDPVFYSPEAEKAGKEKQQFCERHSCGYGVHLEYIPFPIHLPGTRIGQNGLFVDPHERAELALAKLIVKLDVEKSDNMQIQLETAGSWKSLRYSNQAVREYIDILKRNPSNPQSREAAAGLKGALEDLSFPADLRAELFRQLDREVPSNPYIKLARAQALLDTYQAAYLEGPDGVMKLAQELTSSRYAFDQKLRAEAYLVLVEANLRRAENKTTKYTELEKQINPNTNRPVLDDPLIAEFKNIIGLSFKESLDTINLALGLPNLDGETIALLHLKKADIYHKRAQAKLLAEEFDKSERLLARFEDLNLADYEYRQALASNSLQGEDVASAIIGIAQVRKEMALALLYEEQKLSGYYSDHLYYLPEKTEEGIEIRRNILLTKDQYKSALAIYNQVVALLSGRSIEESTEVEDNLEEYINSNIRRISAFSGGKEVQRIILEQNRTLELRFRSQRLALINYAYSGVEKLDKIQLDIKGIMRLTPVGGTVGHLGRILFFVKNHETRKALRDCESLIRLARGFASNNVPNLVLTDGALYRLRVLGQKILVEMQKEHPSAGNLRAPLEQALETLHSQTQTDLVKALIEEINSLLNPRSENRVMENLRELIGLAIEENDLLEGASANPQIMENVLQLQAEVKYLKFLIERNDFTSAAEEIERYLKEVEAPGAHYYNEFWKALETIAWAFYWNQSPQPALNILSELLNEPYLTLSGGPSSLDPFLRILRDKQTRNFFSSLQNDADRRNINFIMGKMYRFSGEYEKDKGSVIYAFYQLNSAREYHLKAMGIDPETARIGLEETNYYLGRAVQTGDVEMLEKHLTTLGFDKETVDALLDKIRKANDAGELRHVLERIYLKFLAGDFWNDQIYDSFLIANHHLGEIIDVIGEDSAAQLLVGIGRLILYNDPHIFGANSGESS